MLICGKLVDLLLGIRLNSNFRASLSVQNQPSTFAYAWRKNPNTRRFVRAGNGIPRIARRDKQLSLSLSRTARETNKCCVKKKALERQRRPSWEMPPLHSVLRRRVWCFCHLPTSCCCHNIVVGSSSAVWSPVDHFVKYNNNKNAVV